MVLITPEETAAFEKVRQEFSGLTNEQAYACIFSKRMMQPIPHKNGEFYGTDQRKDMVPYLHKLVSELPENGQIFDVGAGAGDVVEFALKDVKKAVIHIEEPNPVFVKAYQQRVNLYPNLQLGVVYQGSLQDFYTKGISGIVPRQPQNLILAIHMIYHLTDFTSPKIDAEKDLIDALSFLYGLLAKGGSLFIVYADLLESANGEAVCTMGEKFFRKNKQNYADNLIAIYRAREYLLAPHGSIATILAKHYPDTQPILQSVRKQSHFFGNSIADLAALALAAELCPSDRDAFDLNKLQFCFEYIQRYPERLGLHREEASVPQKGMWRANEPQVIATITKN